MMEFKPTKALNSSVSIIYRMKLLFVRHGQKENEFSQSGIFNGGLTSTGKEQARRLGLSLKNKGINKVYCSELQRAKETLQEVLPNLGSISVVYTKAINEISRGMYPTRQEYTLALKESGLKEHKFRPPEGESYFDVEERAAQFWSFLQKNHQSDTVLIVGHGIFLRFLMLQIQGLHMREMAYLNLDNASLSSFMIEDGKVVSFRVNDCTHLLQYAEAKQDVKVETKIEVVS